MTGPLISIPFFGDTETFINGNHIDTRNRYTVVITNRCGSRVVVNPSTVAVYYPNKDDGVFLQDSYWAEAILEGYGTYERTIRMSMHNLDEIKPKWLGEW